MAFSFASRFAFAFALALAFAGCDLGDAGGDGCHRAADCPGGSCIVGACVMLTNPLDASIPDLATVDASHD